jgi:serine/threonine protein phosphatase PrpC
VCLKYKKLMLQVKKIVTPKKKPSRERTFSKVKRITSRKKLQSDKPLEVKYTTATDIGKRQYQEDKFIAIRLDERPEIYVFAVFDGHGGKQCSEFCARKLPKILNRMLVSKKNVKNFRLDTFLKVALDFLCKQWDNHILGKENVSKVYTSQDSRDEYYKNIDYKQHLHKGGDAGTTVVVALVDTQRRKLVFGNCGDSRAVVLPKNLKTFTATNDHVVPLRLDVNNFQVEIKDGRVASDLAMVRSFGDHSKQLSGVISREIDITSIDVKLGGRLVLGSDGLFDIFSNAEVFVNKETAQELVDRKKDMVDDNITVLVVDLISPTVEQLKKK